MGSEKGNSALAEDALMSEFILEQNLETLMEGNPRNCGIDEALKENCMVGEDSA